MKTRIIWLLLLMMFSIPQVAWAALSDSIPGTILKPRSAVQTPALKVEAMSVLSEAPSKIEMTGARFAVHNDAVTGDQRLRLVIDVTGPVQASATLSTDPDPSLKVDIKGAALGNLTESLTLDGDIAAEVSFLAIDGDNSRLTISLPAMIDDSDYRVFTLPSDSKANRPYRVVVDVNKPLPPTTFNFTAGLKNKVIVLDPGHGGSDSGAIGLNQTPEKTVTLAVAQKVKTMLEKAGAKVLMTRQDDCDVYGANATAVQELDARIQVGNKNKADVFLSIHANAFNNRSVGGTATYYYQKSWYDKLLAQSLQASVITADGLQDRGAVPANFYVVKRSLMPAALIEMAFISNPEEEKLLNSPQFQLQMAQGIVNGLDNFFTQAAKQGGGR